jgi:hypothetical protein
MLPLYPLGLTPKNPFLASVVNSIPIRLHTSPSAFKPNRLGAFEPSACLSHVFSTQSVQQAGFPPAPITTSCLPLHASHYNHPPPPGPLDLPHPLPFHPSHILPPPTSHLLSPLHPPPRPPQTRSLVSSYLTQPASSTPPPTPFPTSLPQPRSPHTHTVQSITSAVPYAHPLSDPFLFWFET